MDEQKVNELANQLVEICKHEHPEIDNESLQDDAKKAVIEMLSGSDFLLHILKRNDGLVLLFAKYLLHNGLLNSQSGNLGKSTI